MPNSLTMRRFRLPGWRAWLALALSVLLHALLLGGFSFHLPDLESETSVIEAQLVMPAPPVAKMSVPQPAPARPAAPKPVAKRVEPAKPPSPMNSEVPAPQPQPSSGSDTAAPQIEPEPLPPAVPEAVAQPMPPIEPPAAEDMPRFSLKPGAHLDMEFDVRRGNGDTVDSSPVGITRISLRAGEDGNSYTLKSVTEAKGLLSLFLAGNLLQSSEGRLTAQGLQPMSYLYQYGDNPDKAQRASFDWPSRRVTLQYGKTTKTVELVDGAQDYLSFMYQFMFEPPLERMQLAVTNGKRLRSYSYQFEGETNLTTKIGELRTLHIGRSNAEGDEKTELWLAPDYQYLPVKIRKTEQNGSVIEQVVRRLDTDILK